MGKAFDTFKGKDIDPAFCHWFAGFADGEGCFSIHKKNVNGYETYDCQFSITLRADDRPILERIQRTLKIGTLSKPTAHKTGPDNPKARFSVSSQEHCLRLRDLFRAFPLRAKKAMDFEVWADALDAWIRHEHGGSWKEVGDLRDALMESRTYKAEGIRIDPFQMWTYSWAIEVLRILKPGGMLLAFGGTRTFHRLACALEDAGFEIRDCLMWLYGGGFPKSLDISKAIDRAKGKTRKIVGNHRRGYKAHYGGSLPVSRTVAISIPTSDAAKQWDGWGTALKPAWEPIILARKPLPGGIAKNVLQHGTGALNIGECRVGISGGVRKVEVDRSGAAFSGEGFGCSDATEPVGGRWPANLILAHSADCRKKCLDDCPVVMLDQQSGLLNSPDRPISRGPSRLFGIGSEGFGVGYGDFGGTSRFFYTAKVGRAERELGLGGLQRKRRLPVREQGGEQRTIEVASAVNDHPTVKPVGLMRWLCRLVTPPGGVVLDPFLGSGSTGRAALAEGLRFIGIEKDGAMCKIAVLRIGQGLPPEDEDRGDPDGVAEAPGCQTTLFGLARRARRRKRP